MRITNAATSSVLAVALVLLARGPPSASAFTTPTRKSTTNTRVVEHAVMDLKAAKTKEETAAAKAASVERTAVNAQELAEEEAFLKQCAKLCQERNLQFDSVKNARDLASVANSKVKPNRIFRMGRVSDASDADIELLLGTLNIQTLVDLRSPTELKDDPTLMREAVFGNFTDILWKEQRNKQKSSGCVLELPKGKPPVKPREHQHDDGEEEGNNNNSKRKRFRRAADRIAATFSQDDDDNDDEQAVEAELDECGVFDCSDEGRVSQANRKERYFVSLMNEFKYVKGTVSKLRKRDLTKAILKSPGAIVSRRMRDSLKKPFLDEINDGGLPMLNELLLRFGAPGIRYVLELCADTDRHPIAFYCTAGKDRTGMIAAIILGLTGVQPKDIVEDYTLSANVYAEMGDHQAMVGALSQRNLDPKTFLGAPANVMRDTLQAINETYGSVEGYCDWIGFDKSQQEKLRKACMEE